MATDYEDDEPEERVIAVTVRQGEPQYVADDMSDLLEKADRLHRFEWYGEQCDSCGCSAYVVEEKPNRHVRIDLMQSWQVRCSGNPDEAADLEADGADPDLIEAVRTGCGATYRLQRLPEKRVIF